MEDFIIIFMESNMNLFKDKIEIDGVEGIFEITKNYIKFIWFDINFYDDREWKMEFNDIEELKNAMIHFANLKFWNGNPICDPLAYKLQKQFQSMKKEKFNIDISECYVCLENCKDYKTICNHDICYQCFLKSIKYTNNPDNGWEFKCGICRQYKFKLDN